MKKSLFVLTAALMFGGMATAQTAATASAPQVPAMTDVPAGHWAKDAIDRLIGKGIILGYPDGTFRGTQNLTRYEAAVIIARLLEQMAQGPVVDNSGNGMNSEDLTALQNAVQELAADLAALGVRVSDLEENAVSKDDFGRLEARVEELAAAQGDAEAVAKLQAQIDDLSARADEYDTLRADVDDAASSIAALNDLTVLLNQDILDLQDRVSAVEAAQADFVLRSDFDNLSGKVTAIDTRVATLEKAPKFSVSGTVSASYGRLALTNGTTTSFDVDRLTRQTFADGVFSTGVNCPGGSYAVAGSAVNCLDTTNSSYVGNGSIVFGVKASGLTTTNGQLIINNAALNFYADNSFKNLPNGVGVYVDNADMDGTLNGQKFDVKYHSYRSDFKFNDYLFANDKANEGTKTPTYRRGIVANIQADQLPLKPKLTVVAGVAGANADLKDYNGKLANGSVPGFTGGYYGVRASVNPANLGTFAVSFAQSDESRSALSADMDLGFGTKDADGQSPFTVKGVYVASVSHTNSTFATGGGTAQAAIKAANQALYIEGKADVGIAKLGAFYGAVDPAYANGEAGMSVNDAPYFGDTCTTGFKGSQPYCPDSKGFGVAAAAKISIVGVDAYYETYKDYAGKDKATNNFGVAAGLKFRGLKAVGFYNNVKQGDTVITRNTSSVIVDKDMMEIAYVPFAYTSSYGGVLRHDGKASDALVKNLNFTVAYARFYDAKLNDIQVYGDYSGTFAGLTVAPFARYHTLVTPSADPVTTGSDKDIYAYSTLKYGAKISTQPFTAIPLQPSAFVNFAQRQTTVKNGKTDGSNVTGETLVQAGVSLNRLFADNLKASVGYAYYQGKNVSALVTGGSSSSVSATYSPAADRIYSNPNSYNPFVGDNNGTNNGSLNGIFAQMDWSGLQANYGIFKYNNTNDTKQSSIAQGFKVSYTFKF